VANLNKVFLAGNLTRDPEVRYAPSGDAVGDLHMAVNRRYRTRDGQEKEETCFIGIVVWGRQAETCAEYLHKGSPILVEGRLQFEQWERDGQKNTRIRVRADRVQFLGSPRSAEFSDGRPPRPSPPRPDPSPQPTAPAGDQKRSEEDEPEPPFSGPSGDEDNLPF
jgi:single-strand DNA-binding protein